MVAAYFWKGKSHLHNMPHIRFLQKLQHNRSGNTESVVLLDETMEHCLAWRICPGFNRQLLHDICSNGSLVSVPRSGLCVCVCVCSGIETNSSHVTTCPLTLVNWIVPKTELAKCVKLLYCWKINRQDVWQIYSRSPHSESEIFH